MGPPSSGGVHVIQMLNILESHNVSKFEHNSSEYINLLTEIMKYAYADRSKYLGDPDYYEVPVSQIISKNYAKTINEKIKIGKVTPSSVIYPGTFMTMKVTKLLIFLLLIKMVMPSLQPILLIQHLVLGLS